MTADPDDAAMGDVPDLVAPKLAILFVGINPGVVSGATGHHFARPGNRFWPVLHDAGFTPHRLAPADQAQLLELGLGITNLVGRTTAAASELTIDELREGGRRVTELADRLRPSFVAFLGLTTYRAAFGRAHAVVGEQHERTGRAQTWVLPNPSGLNAGWSRARLTDAYADLRRAALPSPGDVIAEPERPRRTTPGDAEPLGPR